MKAIRCFFQKPPLDSKNLSLHGIGIREIMRPGIVDRPSGTGDYLLMFFYQNTVVGTAEVEGRKICPPDTMMLWEKGAGHYYGCREGRWNHSWIHCDGNAIPKLLRETGFVLNKPVHGINPVTVERCLFDLYNELHNEHPEEKIALNIFHNFFLEIKRESDHSELKNRIPEVILATRITLETKYRKKFSLKKLAGRANLSIPHFCALFKLHFGDSPIEYLLKVRMKHAAILIRDVNRRIGEVASEIGYEDIYYFSRLFRKRFGVSPLQYRNKILKNHVAVKEKNT